jgi:hypothetical protein
MTALLKTGELLVKEGLICLKDVDMALSIQKKRPDSVSIKKNRLLGMILCDLNLVTPVDNYYILHKYKKIMSIQSALVSTHKISKEVVSRTWNESQQQGIPFISFLLKTGLVSTGGMQALLFDLFHIPFRSISDFIFNEKNREELISVLNNEQSHKTGIIPMVLKDNTILFGITDPDNIVFIRQLNDLYPQYRFKTLFIPFSGFSWFHEIIYDTRREETAPEKEPLDLSLLLSFRTSVKSPEKEKESIQILYKRYERLRQLIGKPKRETLQDEFYKFIIQTHKSITREYKSHSIEFSLKKEDRDVKLMAFPKK